jgi:hypothetical protein
MDYILYPEQTSLCRIFRQQRLHPRHQIWNPERLRHHSIHTSLHGDIDLLAPRIGSDGDDRNVTDYVTSGFVLSDSSYAG